MSIHPDLRKWKWYSKPCHYVYRDGTWSGICRRSNCAFAHSEEQLEQGREKERQFLEAIEKQRMHRMQRARMAKQEREYLTKLTLAKQASLPPPRGTLSKPALYLPCSYDLDIFGIHEAVEALLGRQVSSTIYWTKSDARAAIV